MTVVDIKQGKTRFGERDGRVFVSWDPRVLQWVAIDEPDAHRRYLSHQDRDMRIRPCPYDRTLNFQIVERPSFKEGMTFWQLIDEMHEWIEKMGFQYAIDRRWDGSEFGWKVGFLTKPEAAAFKLAWWKPLPPALFA